MTETHLKIYFVLFFRVPIWPNLGTMLSFKSTRHLHIVVLVYLLLFTSVAENGRAGRPRLRRCWKRKYITEVKMEGTFSDLCRKNVTLHKCEGFCKSQTGPVSSELGIYWQNICKCCQPANYKPIVIEFPACGGSKRLEDISNCHCQDC